MRICNKASNNKNKNITRCTSTCDKINQKETTHNIYFKKKKQKN